MGKPIIHELADLVNELRLSPGKHAPQCGSPVIKKRSSRGRFDRALTRHALRLQPVLPSRRTSGSTMIAAQRGAFAPPYQAGWVQT